MEFTEKRKQELRKSLEQYLKSVPEGKRIHLDKEILEQLMFFYDKEIGVNRPKYIVWSGDFLSKIDLSEIDFKDVVWDVDCKFSKLKDSRYINYYEEYGITQINLKNTNSKIDFYNSWTYKVYNLICLNKCNFKGVDLSNNTLSCENSKVDISNSDLSNTNLKIKFLEHNQEFTLKSTNLSNLDLSFNTVTEESFNNGTIIDCNLSNTGLRIKSSSPVTLYLEDIDERIKLKLPKTFQQEIEMILNPDIKAVDNVIKKLDYINSLIKTYNDTLIKLKNLSTLGQKGYLNGCYWNDLLINKKTYEDKHFTVVSLKGKMFDSNQNNIKNSDTKTNKK